MGGGEEWREKTKLRDERANKFVEETSNFIHGFVIVIGVRARGTTVYGVNGSVCRFAGQATLTNLTISGQLSQKRRFFSLEWEG